ncbi:MAG: hypothetical protein ABFS86_13980 [Planctomycetota bacterium]
MRLRVDAADVLLIGYPMLLVAAAWLFPDIVFPVFLLGAIIGIPLFLLQGRGKPSDHRPARPRQIEWFKLFLAGVVFAWPFIIAKFLGWQERRRR